MKKNISLALALLLSWGVFAQEKETLAEIETSLGTMIVKLYNDTPRHRDNFIRLAKEGHYDGTLFYRVIKEFMIQGGSSDSRNARPGQVLGYGKEVTIPAEFRPGHYHKKGALAAPRQPDNMNMDKDSDISQFYIVQGKKYTATELENYIKSINVPIKRKIQEKYYYPKKPLLDSLRAAHNVPEFKKVAGKVKEQINAEWKANTEKIEMSEQMRRDYVNYGGCPHLDGEYTVFGEVIAGFEVIDKIASLPTDKHDRPLTDVRITKVTILDE